MRKPDISGATARAWRLLDTARTQPAHEAGIVAEGRAEAEEAATAREATLRAVALDLRTADHMDGPCWCLGGHVEHAGFIHSPRCLSTRAALAPAPNSPQTPEAEPDFSATTRARREFQDFGVGMPAPEADR